MTIAISRHLGFDITRNRIPTYVITIHERHRQTERRTDRRHAVARPRFAL